MISLSNRSTLKGKKTSHRKRQQNNQQSKNGVSSNELKGNKAAKKNATHKKRSRPELIIIYKKGDMTYADILRKVKSDWHHDEGGYSQDPRKTV